MDIQWLLEVPQQKTASGRTLTGPLALRAGDLLIASVLEVEKSGNALLSFGHFKAYARLPLPVVAGQDVHIRVEAADEGLRLVMEPKTGGEAGSTPGEHLPIDLFETLSDAPILSARSRYLIPGQSLEGRITGVEKDGLQLVDFGKFKAFAKIDIPVRQGQTIPLTVIKTAHGIALAVTAQTRSSVSAQPPATVVQNEAPAGIPGAQPAAALQAAHLQQPITIEAPVRELAGQPSPPPTSAEMAGLREVILDLLDETNAQGKTDSLPVPAKKALINLRQILNPASPSGDPAALAARISRFVENSGLYFEKHLEQTINSLHEPSTPMAASELAAQASIHNLIDNDLKPNLLILKQYLETRTSENQPAERQLPKMMEHVIQRAVTHIAQQHLTATHKPADPVLYQSFSHPLFLTDPPRNARLKVYYAKKGRDDAHKPPRVSLLLEMDRMGTVRTDLWMVGKDLNVTFFVQETTIKTAIDDAQNQIKAMLEDTFSTVAVSVVVNEKKIAAFDEEDLTISERGLVDLSV